MRFDGVDDFTKAEGISVKFLIPTFIIWVTTGGIARCGETVRGG